MTDQILPTTAAISAIAGVSKATTSRALNNDPRISEKTRAHVWTIAADLGYTPNAIAQSLATQKSRIIGFIGSVEPNYWYQEKIQDLVEAIAAVGMQTMIFQVPSDANIAGIVPEMVRYRLAGSIVIPTVRVTHADAEALARYNIPIVLLNRRMGGKRTFSVSCDQTRGARAVAQFLTAAGHKRIALIAGPDTPTAIARENGFVAGLAHAGQALFRRAEGNFTFTRAYAETRRLMMSRSRPDAIFAANDLMAFGVLDAVRSLGMNAPNDVSVVGFDNAGVAAWPSYQLTTVAQPIEQMFRKAVAQIEQRDRGGAPRLAKSVVLQGELVLRHTARVPEVLSDLPISVRRGP